MDNQDSDVRLLDIVFGLVKEAYDREWMSEIDVTLKEEELFDSLKAHLASDEEGTLATLVAIERFVETAWCQQLKRRLALDLKEEELFDSLKAHLAGNREGSLADLVVVESMLDRLTGVDGSEGVGP